MLKRLPTIYLIFTALQFTEARAEVFVGNPNNYLTLLRRLTAGDTLLLESGNYDDPNDVPGLPIFNLNGKPDRPIVITGYENRPRPIFLGRSTHNTVRFNNASYVTIRHLEIDGRNLGGDGVNAQGLSHHITFEHITIRGVGDDQQVVGISTKATAWDWVIRHVTIIDAGTGMYFGQSDGSAPFLNGLIEYNLIMNTLGYNMQIKHQIGRPNLPGIPQNSATIIRHNVFSKAQNGAGGASARPNVLVGHWPLSGPGANDVYQIYGNFFYQNPTEALFQGEGNIALYNNLLVNHAGDAIHIQPHNDIPKMIRVFTNTVVANGTGIQIVGGAAAHQQKVIGNACFALTPIQAADQQDNLIDAYQAASNYLVNPTASPNMLDLYPRPGKLKGTPIGINAIEAFQNWDRDFNGAKHDQTFRGAYAGEGQNPGWLPKLEIRPLIMQDMIAPKAVADLRMTAMTATSLTISWTAPGDDDQSGGPVASYDLRYSNKPTGPDLTAWFNSATKVENIPMPRPPGSQETVSITGLLSATEYTFLLRSLDDAGNRSGFSNSLKAITVGVHQEELIPHRFGLEQNFPNPFWSGATSRFAGNSETVIRFDLPQAAGVTAIIFDALGQEMIRLLEQPMNAGSHSLSWNGRNKIGQEVGSGIYFLKLRADENIAVIKMLLVR